METRKLGAGGLEVSEQGLGCMGMSAWYGPTDEQESIATIHRALELGITFLDTADVYGQGHNEELVGRAIAVHPLTALQSEWSLWPRDPEADVLPTVRELGIGFVAYSPLGRGFLAGRFSSPEELTDDDFRRNHPRLTGDNFERNRELADHVRNLAAAKGCTP